MPNAAGSVNIVLGMNAVTFTQGIKNAQAELDKFAGKAKTMGHSGVTNVQAVSASLRSLNGGFENNLRSMERWVAQSKTATAVAKTLFPVIGAATFGFMIGSLILKVVDFVEQANKMPKAIEMGFGSLLLSSQTSIDSLRLTNDQLANAIAKLEGKHQNNLAIQFDEAAKAADKLAASIESGSNKLNELLSKNHLSGWALLTGKQGTADREGTIKAFGDQQDSNAYDLADATSRGDKGGIAKAQSALKATQNSELASLRGDLSNREANSKNPGALNDTANMNIDKGAIAEILKQQQEQAQEVRNSQLTAQKQSLDDAKASSEQAKKAAGERVAAMQTALDGMKLQYNLSIKATYDYWELKKSTELAGGTAYNDIVKKQSELAVQAAAKAHETITKAIADAKRTSGEDATTGPALINQSAKFMQSQAVKDGSEKTQGYVDNNRLSIDKAGNDARQKEAQITDASGKSMSRYAAAVQLANVHTQEFVATQTSLQAILNARKDAQRTNPSQQNEHAVTAAQADLDNANSQRGMQVTSDANNIMPPSTSLTTGFDDAINEFVTASRDGAGMMKDIVNNTLSGLNNQLVSAMTGGKTNFKQFGLGVTRNVAGAALQKGEGAIMSAFGGGKLGSKGNPMHVTMEGGKLPDVGIPKTLPGVDKLTDDADADKSDLSKVGSGITSTLGKAAGGIGSFFSKTLGMAAKFLPFLATGGPIDGPAIVGEKGPELFVPSSSGRIIPNHQLTTSSSSSGGGQNITYSIDARGTDPVQTEQRVRSSIVASHQSAVTQSVKQVQQQNARRPARSK